MSDEADEFRNEVEPDIPGRVQDAVGNRVDSIKSAITGTVSEARDRARDIAPDLSDVQDRAGRAARAIRQNPLGLFFGAAAIGFVVGTLIPVSKIERERLGPIADQLKEQAKGSVAGTIANLNKP